MIIVKPPQPRRGNLAVIAARASAPLIRAGGPDIGSGGNSPQVPSAFGVNMSGAEFAPWNGQTFPSAADWTYLASKGVSFVRLPIAWESVQPVLSAALNTTYLANIKSAISSANAVGIKVIVDVHNFARYVAQAQWTTSIGYAGNGGVSAANVSNLGDGTLTSAAFVDLQTRLSTALVGTAGLLGYGLMNEPSGIVGTNLFQAPNYLTNTSVAQTWFVVNGAARTQLAAGTNPLGASYGPAWAITSGTGFGAVVQQLTLAATPYTVSCYAYSNAGTENLQFNVGASSSGNKVVTTTPTRFSFTVTPSAGSQQVQLQVNAAAGHTINVANAQIELGSSATTYEANPFLTYAQAGINAIRAVDAATPIYVNGAVSSLASGWPQYNYEFVQLTGTGLVFEAHQYFDGAQGVGGGGTYAGTYTSFSIDNNSGTQATAPFLAWLVAQAKVGYLGEFGVPNSVADNNPQWLILQRNVLNGLAAAGVRVPATMWFYGSNGLLAGGTLNVAPVGGVDDPRLTQMLAIQ